MPSPGAARATSPVGAEGATPAISQWFAIKAEHPDALLFFRMGDFYEMFFADAEAAAAALDIQLTCRGEHGGQPIAMCGVPVHAAENYLSRLIRRGFRVAIVEQMEARARGKAPIRREVARLVTPGTIVEDTLLESGRANWLLALAPGSASGAEKDCGAAWMDISTGLFETACIARSELPALLGRLDPAEILCPPGLDLDALAARRGPEPAPPAADAARRLLTETYQVASLDAFGSFTEPEIIAAGWALAYAKASQVGKLPRLARPMRAGPAGLLAMDAATRASLEITRALDGGVAHTLLSAVQRTVSAPGARLLAGWLAAPLTDAAAIADRQARWGALLGAPDLAAALRAALKGVPDMARALGRLALGRFTPRDLGAVRDGLAVAHDIAVMLDRMPEFTAGREALIALPALRDLLGRALADTLPARLEDGGAVAPGFDGEWDAQCALRDDSRRVIATLQLDYAQRYGVASLKIRHHQQMGYVIEVPAVAVEKLRAQPDLQLRQGMANGARFTHPDLSALDQKIAEAAALAAARERVVIDHLVREVLAEADAVSAAAAALAMLDAVQSAARLAEGGSWCRPEITEDDQFCIRAGRHPVVEAAIAGQTAFVPNDCDLSPDRRVLLLTGPNMAGKSTYLRQNALIVILAQAGLPVPAASARIGVVDRLFSRVGAADDLARGRSTFMVEMTETAAILHQAGPRSLVVVDEIGRGTATLDGMAIAWAVLEALHFQNRCRTIFATHFHELGQLRGELTRLLPHTMRVVEWRGGVRFLHEVAEGAAGRSWGVHVAALAGVPAPTVRRAGLLLKKLEGAGPLTAAATLPLFAASLAEPPESTPAPAAAAPAEAVMAVLAEAEPDQMSPRDALDTLYRLKKLVLECDAREQETSPRR